MNTNRGTKPRFNSAAYEANVAALPELCFDKSPGDDNLVVLKRGERGYYPADADKYPLAPGFDSPGANPKAQELFALVEDLRAVDQRLGDEASQMMRAGASFEEVRGRFANIYSEAHAARVGFPTMYEATQKALDLNAALPDAERAYTIYEGRRSLTTHGFYVAKVVEGAVEEAIYASTAEVAA